MNGMPVPIPSSLLPSEYFHLHGRLEEAHILALLECEHNLQSQEGLDGPLNDARASYPAEDFLAGVESDLNDLAKKLRGANKDTLKAIIEKLSDIAQCTFNESDFGRSEIDKVVEALGYETAAAKTKKQANKNRGKPK